MCGLGWDGMDGIIGLLRAPSVLINTTHVESTEKSWILHFLQFAVGYFMEHHRKIALLSQIISKI